MAVSECTKIKTWLKRPPPHSSTGFHRAEWLRAGVGGPVTAVTLFFVAWTICAFSFTA
jgi:hypothetical protein